MPDQDEGRGEKPNPAQEQQNGPSSQPNFETWLGAQDEPTQALIDAHIGGLQRALTAERSQRKDFERQLKEATRGAEKDSETRKKLEDLSGSYRETQQQLDFYDLAHREGMTNIRLGWLAAKADGLVDEKGRVNMAELKEKNPELFRSSTPVSVTAHAGAGTGNSSATSGSDMNQWIRTAAGRA